MPDLTVSITTSLKAIAAAEWDAVANPPSPCAGADDPHNPFVSHAFLSALEEAGCVGPGTGWSPCHLVLREEGKLAGAVPCYLKTHSQGEYVFDHAWADAYLRTGRRYYPKLQVSVPFTPVTGPRLLAGAGPGADDRRRALLQGLVALQEETKASSVHLTFLREADAATAGRAAFLPRIDQQFHWLNEGYATFEDFLEALSSRKRKAIRRERREAVASGLTLEAVTGSDLTEAHWDAFFRFYMDTGSRKWGRPYLNRRFFSLVGEGMRDRVVLFLARRGGRPVAGALNFLGDSALYGRHWGCVEHHPFLHFELCYYQAIEFGILHGLKVVEAGAQGEHKLARGYRPVITRSAHAFADPLLRRAIADYLDRERTLVGEISEELAEAMPFRRVELAADRGITRSQDLLSSPAGARQRGGEGDPA